MSRLVPSVAAMLAVSLFSAPAWAADQQEDWSTFRDAYPSEPADWAGLGDKDDPIALEFGVRYWYSMGGKNFSSSGSSLTESDTAHIGELHLRIEDHSTNTFAKALAGYSFLIGGSYTDPISTGAITDGSIGYIGADLGWNAFGDNNGSGAGALIGFMHWNDSPNTGRNNYTTLNSGSTVTYDTGTGQTFIPGASATNNIYVNMLRLGVQGKAKLGDFFDVSGELVAVPYASVGGTVGVDDPTFSTAVYGGAAQLPYSSQNGNISSMRSSATEINGWGYGAAAEAWIGMHPTDNITFRVGGRAWYLQGSVDATYSAVQITDPSDAVAGGVNYDTGPVVTEANYISTANPFSMFRYGVLAELTYAF